MCMKPMKRSQKKEILRMNDHQINSVVKIQGTKYDRKRKISDATIKKMNKMYEKGYTVPEICKALNLNNTAVRYHVDPSFRIRYNQKRNGAHTGVDKITVENRIAYKKELVNKRKISVK